jgi:hypothetical protein
MRTSADWDNIVGHSSTISHSAPWAVPVTLAALVDDDRIEQSWVEYKPAKPTTWTVYAVTAEKNRLAYAELQFNAEGYDSQEDQNNPIEATIKAAWIRPLNNVVKLQIGKVGLFVAAKAGTHFGVGSDWFPVGDVHLTFVDGETVTLPIDQGKLDNQTQRDRSDRFLAAVRAGVGF